MKYKRGTLIRYGVWYGIVLSTGPDPFGALGKGVNVRWYSKECPNGNAVFWSNSTMAEAITDQSVIVLAEP